MAADLATLNAYFVIPTELELPTSTIADAVDSHEAAVSHTDGSYSSSNIRACGINGASQIGHSGGLAIADGIPCAAPPTANLERSTLEGRKEHTEPSGVRATHLYKPAVPCTGKY